MVARTHVFVDDDAKVVAGPGYMPGVPGVVLDLGPYVMIHMSPETARQVVEALQKATGQMKIATAGTVAS